jgi:VanZ family protein
MKTKLLAMCYFLFLAVVVYCADSSAHQHLFSFIRSIPGGDKSGHFMLMGAFALLLNLSLSFRVVAVAGKALLIGSIAALTLITIEEFSQRYIPYRTFDLLDLLADFAGVLIFSRLALMFRERQATTDVAADAHR